MAGGAAGYSSKPEGLVLGSSKHWEQVKEIKRNRLGSGENVTTDLLDDGAVPH